MEPLDRYRANFIKAILQAQADNPDLKTRMDVANWLGVGKVTLYNIMDGKQSPTVEQAIKLCTLANLSANWLFLGVGPMKLGEETNMVKELQQIRKALKRIEEATLTNT